MQNDRNNALATKLAHAILLPLYAPLILLAICSWLFGGIFWPIPSTELATLLVPKLATEGAGITLQYSEAAAQAYTTTYANYLLLCLVAMAPGFFRVSRIIMFQKELLALKSKDMEYDSHRNTDVKYFKRIISSSLSLAFFGIMVFLVPSVIKPSVGISASRALSASYAAMVFFCSMFSINFLAVLLALIFSSKSNS